MKKTNKKTIYAIYGIEYANGFWETGFRPYTWIY